MPNVFPAFRFQQVTKHFDDLGNEILHGPITFLALEPETEEFIGEKCDLDWPFFQRMFSVPGLWAVVFYTAPLQDAETLMSIRGDLANTLKFASNIEYIPGGPLPPFRAMVVLECDSLELAAAMHPTFKEAWDVLKDCDKDQNWAAIMDNAGEYDGA